MENKKKMVEHNKDRKTLDFSIPLNPWMLSTIVLAIIVLIFIFVFLGKGLPISNSATPINNSTGNVNTAKVIQDIPQTIVKSDKPVVEPFVFSYCPYGLQFEKALSPVYDLLKDKTDIRVVFIGAMHGEYEKIESYRQICIQKIYDKDKLWKYLNAFTMDVEIGKCKKGEEICVNPLIEKIFTSNGIDKSKIDSCMKNDAEKIYNQDVARAKELGATGSPTLVINNAKVKFTRSPDAIKELICSAFNSVPSSCSTKLSATQANSGFGIGTAKASSASC